MAERAEYKVEGLDCAEEVNLLRGALEDRPGVLDLDFDLLNARMAVDYDPELTASGVIAACAAETGLKVVPWEERGRVPSTFWEEHGRMVAVCTSGALLLAGFLTHWAQHGSFLGALTRGHGAEQHVLPTPSLMMYWLSAVAGAWFVLPKAAGAAVRFRPDMNLLMTVAVIGAVAIGEYFEAATVAFLFAVALQLEHWSMDRARRAISSLLDLSPDTARCVDPDTGQVVERPATEVPIGTIIVVRPGDRVPLDGQVVVGESSVNEAPITGESRPVPKTPGEGVYAGTINEQGSLQVEVQRTADDTTLAHIIRMVRESQSRRAPAERWVEKFARYYTPAMMTLAAAFVLVPPMFFGGEWSEWLYRGLVLLVVACPCALVISTPVTIVSALTSSARRGVLIKGGAYLEAVGRIDALAIDKTGTLTYGRPEVLEIIPFEGHEAGEVLETAAAVEADSVHPLADAIIRKATDEGVRVRRPEEFIALRGKGAEAVLDGEIVWVGSHRLMEERGVESEQGHRRAEEIEGLGQSVVAVGKGDHTCGLIRVSDGVREDAQGVIRALHEAGVAHVAMLTGDNDGTARAVAQATGVDDYRSEQLPEEKVRLVEELRERFGFVGMVGDGINDAPALAAANIGIAMGAIGSDAAIETADVTLMADELERLPWLIGHSRRALKVVKANVGLALGTKFAFIILAFFGVATLWQAIAADMGASLLVTFNGLRLLGGGRR